MQDKAEGIAFLLQEMDKWLGEGVLTQDAYDILNRRYSQEREQIIRLAAVERLLTEARLARAQGWLTEAFSKTCKALEADPENVECRLLLAGIHEDSGRLDEALSVYQALAAQQPDSAIVQSALRRVQTTLEDQRRQQEQAAECARIRQEQERQQREQAEKVAQARREKAQKLLGHAREAMLRGDYVTALDTARSSLELDSEPVGAWELAAQACWSQGMLSQAEDAWAQALSRDPHNRLYQDELKRVREERSYQQRPVWNKLWDKASQALEAFMEERNVQWIHLLGASLLIAGLCGVAAWVVTVQQLWGIVGRVAVVVLPLLLSAMFYYTAHKLSRTMKATASTLHCIASALLPIDLLMTKHLFPNTLTWDWNHHLFAVSLLSTLVYMFVLITVRSRILMSFTGAGFLICNIFAIRSFTHLSPGSQGLWIALIGFGYMVAAHWIRLRRLTPLDTPLDVLAHIGMATALGNSIFAGLTAGPGDSQASLTMLVVGFAYAAAAYLLGKTRYLPIFITILFAFIVFAMKSRGVGIDRWYLYGLALGLTGCAFIAMSPVSQVRGRDKFAGWYQWFGLAVTALAVLPTLGKGLIDAISSQSLPSGPEVLPSLLTCLIISVFYALVSVWTDKPRLIYVSAVVFLYASLLGISLAYRPTYEYTVWMMLPAAVFVLLGLHLYRRFEDYGEIVFGIGTSLTTLLGIVSVGMWMDHLSHLGYRGAACIVMLVSTALYALGARATERVTFVWTGIVTGALCWGLGFSWLHDAALASVLGDRANYGLYFFPFTALLMLIRGVMLRRSRVSFAVPFDFSAVAMSIGLLALQLSYLTAPDALSLNLCISLALYSVLFAWQAYSRIGDRLFGSEVSASTVYAYVSVLSALSSYWLVGRQWVMPRIPEMEFNYALWFWPFIATLAVGGHILYKKVKSCLAQPMYFVGALLCVVCICIQPLYSTPTQTITLFAYGLLFVWVSMALRAWAPYELADRLSQVMIYVAAGLFFMGWLLLFEWIGGATRDFKFYRAIAALTGVAWCLIVFRVTLWMSSRDSEWSARPLFWSAVVACILFSMRAGLAWERVLPLAFATYALAIVFYTWIAYIRRDEWFGYGAVAVGSWGYISALSMHFHLVYDHPVQLVLFSVVPAVLAICIGYLSLLFCARLFAYVATLAAEWACFLLLGALAGAAGLDSVEYGALALAITGCLSLLGSYILRRKGFEELATAPAHGSDLAVTLAVLSTILVTFFSACFGESVEEALLTATATISTAIFVASAIMRKRPCFLYAASLAAAIGWGIADLHSLLKIMGDNYALYYTPLAVTIGAAAYIVRAKGKPEFAKPLWYSAMVLSVICITSRLESLSLWGAAPSDVVMLFILAAAYTFAAYLDRNDHIRSEVLVYFACASSLAGLVTVPLPKHLLQMVKAASPFVFAAIGVIWTGLAFYFGSRSLKAWLRPLLIVAGVAEVISISTILADTSRSNSINWSTASVIVAAAVFTCMAKKTELRILIHAAGFAVLIGGLALCSRFLPGEWGVLLSILVPAVGAAVLAEITRDEECAIWFPAMLWTGFAGSVIFSETSPLSPTPAVGAVFAISMGISAPLFVRLARTYQEQALELLAALSGLVSYWYFLVLAHKVAGIPFDPVKHPGITLLPYAAFLAWFGWRQRSLDGEPLRMTYGVCTLVLSVVGLFSGMISGESHTMLTVTFALYTLGYALAAAKFKLTNLIYFANAAAIMAWYTLYLAIDLPKPIPYLGAWFGLLGLLQVILGVAIGKRSGMPDMEELECAIGTVLSSIAGLTALTGTLYTQLYGELSIAALLMSAVANTILAVRRSEIGYVHAGFVGVLLSLYLVFYGKLELEVLSVYALPVGIYLLALPAIYRQVGRKVQSQAYYSAGLAIMLGSGLVTLVQKGWSDWNSYMLLAESVAAFLYGLYRRMKVFFFFGSGFAAVWIAVLMRDSVVRHMHGGTLVAGITGIVIGTILILFASRSEQQRVEIMNSIRQAVHSFREWD